MPIKYILVKDVTPYKNHKRFSECLETDCGYLIPEDIWENNNTGISKVTINGINYNFVSDYNPTGTCEKRCDLVDYCNTNEEWSYYCSSQDKNKIFKINVENT
jgi:hypothetical protein